MAGIGFELRKYLDDDTFTGSAKAYGFAGLISAGPWVLSILGVMLIGVIAVSYALLDNQVRQFTTSVTWLMGASLILTGLLQLMFTRFVADRLYERQFHIINANLFGALVLSVVASALVGIILAVTMFDESLAYEMLMIANFSALSAVWIAVIFVAGLRRFKIILWTFAIAYAVTVVLSLVFMSAGIEGLLLGLFIGHVLLVFMMIGAIVPEYPVVGKVRWDFLSLPKIHPVLIGVGFFYNLGIWVDKIIFWMHPDTSEFVIGPLRASVIYDLPIFLAYLSIIPGMAVFLLTIETEFAEAYEGFFAAVRGNASLREIEKLGNEMVIAVRNGLFQIVRVQGVTVLLLCALGGSLVKWLGLPEKFIHLYYVDLVGVAAQVLMLAVLNVAFYLDKLKEALALTFFMFLSNAVLSWLSIQWGPVYFGYGFGISMALTAVFGVLMIARELDNIEFHTFMRQRSTGGSNVAVVGDEA